jgi:hypothetical protein
MTWLWQRVEARWIVGVVIGEAEHGARLVVYLGRWKLLLAAALLLTACPSAPTLDTERTADCCEVSDGGPCEWMLVRYEAHRYAGPLASDEDACRALGLEPYER